MIYAESTNDYLPLSPVCKRIENDSKRSQARVKVPAVDARVRWMTEEEENKKNPARTETCEPH